MPQSRTRHKHVPHRSVPSHNTHRKAKRSAAFVVSILAAILGLAVAFFTEGADVFWMTVGTAFGGIIGYFIGRNMDRSIEKI